MFKVQKAVRQRRPLKVALEGLSGAGKTFSALRLAFAMRRAGIGKRIAVADSENESASLYADVTIDGEKWEYDTCPIPPQFQNPAGYAEVYSYLVSQGYDIIIIDSLSHAWHGAMEAVDQIAARARGDKFAAWAKVTPDQRRMVSTLTDSRAHLIATMRVKSEYERVQDHNGKDKIRKVGTKADQREGAEYEFDAVIRLEHDHIAAVEKIRGCSAMDGRTGQNIGPDFWQPLLDWWLGAESLPETPALPPAATISPDLCHQAADALSACGTLDDLRTTWEQIYRDRGCFPAEQWAALCGLKDKRKSDLAPKLVNTSAMLAEAHNLIGELQELADATVVAELLRYCGAGDVASVQSLDAERLTKLISELKHAIGQATERIA